MVAVPVRIAQVTIFIAMKTCTHCHTAIKRPISKNTKRPFCDMQCYAAWQKENTFKDRGIIPAEPNRKCKICGERFCGLPRANYCSDACRTVVSHRTFYARPEEEKRVARVASAPEYQCHQCGGNFRSYRSDAKYCSSICSGLANKSPYILKGGYKKVLKPDHSRADKKGYAFEHILVVESLIGRALRMGEEVHHLDHDKGNNNPANLHLCASHREHMQFHRGNSRTS